ncbi:hypothetical protein OG205_09910 [Lentzea sp. NBC_00516]|uniref:hypothetical protein n=1 Tax=Lentzea sp. NBC_00516 TaxID=2903582 RepID=UPI002E80A175|nr:hypothetical protein [Lentzea sp. NBC_00516]WUD27287.1 hypothetical protein OG205_09910 [Lentzea sp. NBC_00516]
MRIRGVLDGEDVRVAELVEMNCTLQDLKDRVLDVADFLAAADRVAAVAPRSTRRWSRSCSVPYASQLADAFPFAVGHNPEPA